MLQEPMPGNAKVKRKQWSRKHIVNQELHFSIKIQKKQFQRHLRNGKGKGKFVELPSKGNAYRKVANGNAKWNFVS